MENPILFAALTKEQIREAVRMELDSFFASNRPTAPSEKPRYVYGVTGLAELLGCSKPTAQKIKNSGKVTYSQVGRKIVFDVEKVLRELGK